jgi:cytochrome P450
MIDSGHRKRPPGPKGHWLLGCAGAFRSDVLGFFARCAAEYGDVAGFRIGWKPVALLSHPDCIERVLVTENRHFKKHFVLDFLRPVLGNGLLTSEGDFWLRQRRLIQPAFAPRRLEGYAESMVALSRRRLEAWRDGQPLDLQAEMLRLTLAIVAKVLLDVDASTDTEEVSSAVDVLMEDFNYRLSTPLAWPRGVPTPWNLRVKRAIRRLKGIIQRIIRERRAEDRGDFLSLLVNARDEETGQGMSDRQIGDEVMTMFLAGHETTANVLTWAWYLLAQHPEAEQKLLNEFASVLNGRAPTVADVPRLAYAERVVQEAMRLYPPAFVVGREAIEDFSVGGYDFPAGTTFLMSQWVVHRDPRWFHDPFSFRPERWSPAAAYALPKYAYFPFGGGPRVCIGNRFAMLEAVLILATLAPHFRFALAPGQTITAAPAVTLRPAQGLLVTAHKRGAAVGETTNVQ